VRISRSPRVIEVTVTGEDRPSTFPIDEVNGRRDLLRSITERRRGGGRRFGRGVGDGVPDFVVRGVDAARRPVPGLRARRRPVPGPAAFRR
jgi:hypothetical protein